MTEKKKKADKRKGHPLDGTEVFGGAAVGAQTASSEAEASDALREGMQKFLEEIENRRKLDPEQLKGFLFERIEVAKFNADAAWKGLDAQARVTADIPGRGTDRAVDIEIAVGEKVSQRVQAKASDDSAWLAKESSDPKYETTTRLVPNDKVGDVNKRLPEGQKVTGQLEQSGASSGGTTHDELNYATDNPKLYALGQEGLQVAREACVASAHTAIAGVVLGGAMSTVRNACAYAQGDIDGKKAAKNVAADATKSGARSGGTAALGAIIRHGADKVGVQALTKSNVASAVAAGVIDAGVTVYSYAQGEISAEVAAERLGVTGCSTLSGIYTGAAGAIFGPAGAVVGSVAGYLLAATVYQSCIVVFKEARLADEEAERIVALCYEAVEVMDRQRTEFEDRLAAVLNDRQASFDGYFEAIDQAFVADRPDDAIQALSGLATSCGGKLKLAGFEEFDKIMTESDAPLVF